MKSNIRDFIWRHWRERKPGKITVMFFGLEGLTSRTTYIVEANQKKVWQISVENRDVSLVSDPGAKPPETIEKAIAVSVQRLPGKGIEREPSEPIKDEAEVDASSYALVSKNAKGEVIDRM